MASALQASVTDLVILCGGRGTRLGALSAVTPKPLLPVQGRPFLAHLLTRMKQQGVTRAVLSAHYLSDQLYEFVRTHHGIVEELQLIVEPEPLGTGGALRYVADWVTSPVFVAINGDTWLEQPIEPVLKAHERSGSACTAVVAAGARVEGGPRQKGVWQVGSDHTVQGFSTPPNASEHWVNGGMYVFDRAVVRSWARGTYSLEDNLPTLLRGHRTELFYSTGRLLDIGTPECLARAGQGWGSLAA